MTSLCDALTLLNPGFLGLWKPGGRHIVPPPLQKTMEIVTKVYKWVYIIYQVLGTRNNKIHNKQIIILMTSALFHDAVGINMLFSPKFWCKIENAIFLEPKVPRRWLTPHWIGITGLLSEIIMKNAYHAMIFAYVSTFLAIFSQKCDNYRWRHKMTSRRQIFTIFAENLSFILYWLLSKYEVIWKSLRYFMVIFVILA